MSFDTEKYNERRNLGLRGQTGPRLTKTKATMVGEPDIEHAPVGSRKEIRQHTKHGPRGRQARREK